MTDDAVSIRTRPQTRITSRRRVDLAFEARELWRRRELAWYLTTSTLKSGHRELLLGQLWWLLEPVISMLIYVFLVQVIFQRGTPNYPVFVFCAILPFRWFTQAVAQGQNVICSIGGLMKDIAFPKAVYPIALTLSNFFNFLMGFGFLVVLSLFMGIYPGLQWLWLPALVAQFFAFTLGTSLLVSAFTVLFQDLKNIVAFVFQIIFYLSPTLYSVDHVPASWRSLFMMNPFAQMFTAWRSVIIENQAPDMFVFGLLCAGSAALLAVGFLVFVRLEKSFPKVL